MSGDLTSGLRRTLVRTRYNSLHKLRTHNKWLGVLFSRDERMLPSLLRSPASKWIQVQQPLAKVDEGCSVIQL